MRHNSKKSSRGNRPQGKKNNKMKVYDSNGPDVRVRGTAYQITEKYEALAKDAERSGNIILAENYRQHLEHYQRIINNFEEDAPVKQPTKQSDKSDDVEIDVPAAMVDGNSVEAEMATA